MRDAAAALEDLRTPPGNRLDLLRGQWGGRRSIRLNEQWRLLFSWRENDAYDVELVDDHG